MPTFAPSRCWQSLTVLLPRRRRALRQPRPTLRTSLNDTEIKRMAEYFYAYELGAEEDLSAEGIGDDPLFASIHQQLSEAGIEFESPFSVEKNGSGLSNRMMHKIEEGA